tara:strand:+ start:1179 stop:1706 length:528 start_codon:yes stop_codon:yes gene_type:complete
LPKVKEKHSKNKAKASNNKKKQPSSSKQKKNNDLENKIQDLQDKHLRLKAEFENFRRRKSEEISKLLQYDGENIIKGFLPIVDDLERMIDSSDSSEESIKDGIKLVQSKIDKYFESINIEPFANKGDKMDPEIHDAMLTQKDDDKEDDIILDVFEKGYTYREKVIRHAKVIVNKK